MNINETVFILDVIVKIRNKKCSGFAIDTIKYFFNLYTLIYKITTI